MKVSSFPQKLSNSVEEGEIAESQGEGDGDGEEHRGVGLARLMVSSGKPAWGLGQRHPTIRALGGTEVRGDLIRASGREKIKVDFSRTRFLNRGRM